jgi:hypothetical protein
MVGLLLPWFSCILLDFIRQPGLGVCCFLLQQLRQSVSTFLTGPVVRFAAPIKKNVKLLITAM